MPVSADKNIPFFFRLFPKKFFNGGNKFRLLHGSFNIFRRGNAFRKFRKNKFRLSSAALLRLFVPEKIKRKIPRYFSEIGRKPVRFFRRNCFPCTEPCIIKAFFFVFFIPKNVPCNFAAIWTVFYGCFRNRVFVPFPKKADYRTRTSHR